MSGCRCHNSGPSSASMGQRPYPLQSMCWLTGGDGGYRERERERTNRKKRKMEAEGRGSFWGEYQEREKKREKKQTRKRSNRRVKCFILKHCFHSTWLNVDFTGVESTGWSSARSVKCFILKVYSKHIILHSITIIAHRCSWFHSFLILILPYHYQYSGHNHQADYW